MAWVYISVLAQAQIKDSIEEGRPSISELAAEHGLSVYDATYLELAVRRQLPLASRDNAICKAAQGCRVKLLL